MTEAFWRPKARGDGIELVVLHGVISPFADATRVLAIAADRVLHLPARGGATSFDLADVA